MTNTTEHIHRWGATEQHWGEPHRRCQVDGCNHITLDLYLYCALCCGPIAYDERTDTYHHVDPESPNTVLTDWDADHEIEPEAGTHPDDWED